MHRQPSSPDHSAAGESKLQPLRHFAAGGLVGNMIVSRPRMVPVTGGEWIGMRKLLWAMAVAAVLGGASPASAQGADPSFDCGKASAPIEVLICNDSELIALDGALGRAYAARRDGLSGAAREALLREQRQWLAARLARCRIPETKDALTLAERWSWAPCVADLYRARLQALGAPAAPLTRPAAAGQPGYLHPLCVGLAVDHVFGEGGQPRLVPVAACNDGYRHVPVATGDAGQLSASGAVDGFGDWIGYRPLGRLADAREALLVYYNGGGTGTFSAIVAVARARGIDSGAESISAERLVAGGDRCVGGITSAKLVDERTISYGVNVPPGDFVNGAGSEVDTEGLPWCMVCCYGELHFQHRLGQESDTLAFATIESLEMGSGDDPTLMCLDGIVREAAASFPATFSPKDLKGIAERFQAGCVKN